MVRERARPTLGDTERGEKRGGNRTEARVEVQGVQSSVFQTCRQQFVSAFDYSRNALGHGFASLFTPTPEAGRQVSAACVPRPAIRGRQSVSASVKICRSRRASLDKPAGNHNNLSLTSMRIVTMFSLPRSTGISSPSVAHFVFLPVENGQGFS
jgi:hypothetical protein